jgi:hypothetical protein
MNTGTGHGPPVFIAVKDLPKFQVRGGWNGFRYVVEVSCVGDSPVTVLGFIVNGRATEGCSTDIPGEMQDQLVQDPRFARGSQISKLPLDRRIGDAFTFTLWPACGRTLAKIDIHTDRGDVTYVTKE